MLYEINQIFKRFLNENKVIPQVIIEKMKEHDKSQDTREIEYILRSKQSYRAYYRCGYDKNNKTPHKDVQYRAEMRELIERKDPFGQLRKNNNNLYRYLTDIEGYLDIILTNSHAICHDRPPENHIPKIVENMKQCMNISKKYKFKNADNYMTQLNNPALLIPPVTDLSQEDMWHLIKEFVQKSKTEQDWYKELGSCRYQGTKIRGSFINFGKGWTSWLSFLYGLNAPSNGIYIAIYINREQIENGVFKLKDMELCYAKSELTTPLLDWDWHKEDCNPSQSTAFPKSHCYYSIGEKTLNENLDSKKKDILKNLNKMIDDYKDHMDTQH